MIYENWNIELWKKEEKTEYKLKINGVEKATLIEGLESTIEILRKMEVEEDLTMMKGRLLKQYYDLLKKLENAKKVATTKK